MKLQCDGCEMLCYLETQDGAESLLFKGSLEKTINKMTCPFPFTEKGAYWHKDAK